MNFDIPAARFCHINILDIKWTGKLIIKIIWERPAGASRN